MNIEQNVSLAQLNTLGVPSVASHLCHLTALEQLPDLYRCVESLSLPVRVLGGGSNLILKPDVHALVIKNELTGIRILADEGNAVFVSAKAGESWHEFVLYCVEHGFYGLENLALIPGTVGAAPVQNIGAYGVEVGSYIEWVDALDLKTGESHRFNQTACRFSYRDSVFKQMENRYLITEVCLKLSRQFSPELSYGPLQNLTDTQDLTAADVVAKVIEVRQSKLPDPQQVPNAGSFFKNPIVSESELWQLQQHYDGIPSYPALGGFKLAAGWLIEQAGLKGQSHPSQVGSYEKQALVLINPARAGYEAVAAWAEHVRKEVFAKFGVELEAEPRLWE
ncbi:UDP-N-acetylmuramate dehydrogenase [Reinekea blandensis]|uniref:UDP-N-acetylenolpyruvoylglucosamine reductase n=1 Tax=Reinekea blandensis MED297 TaxID=314283 RepID=A4BE04_9GAMM|nr:UDP-N-acetylmuramate dehydrogenase [Reinekea blandensis]EAR09763.1 UDP-N-acetylenolpyruvoylglucosamine reductase [Reinekea blandensis MED297]